MNYELVDTHCHIHSADYKLSPEQVYVAARADSVRTMICVGTDVPDSERAVEFVQKRAGCYASIGIHPHDGAKYAHDQAALDRFAALASQPKVVAIGETGLDYFYDHSPHEDQEKLLRFQIELAIKHDLPLIFHVREAFADFWRIFDDYGDQNLRGVIHSFTADGGEVDNVLKRALYFGVNGITTFTKNQWQLDAIKQIPLERLVLETDAPYLTPAPERGNINEPRHVCLTAEFLCGLRNETMQQLTSQTTINAKRLFGLING